MIVLDTNILVYAVSDHQHSAEARRVIARSLARKALLPTQVLAEFANACRKKALIGAEAIAAHITDLSEGFQTVTTEVDDIIIATELSRRFQLQFFDALICTVARRAGASVLLSEDMQDGLRLGTLSVLNPFNAGNADHLRNLLEA